MSSPGPTPGTIGTPLTPAATRVMLLGSGELGKEVALELQRLGVEVVAVDRYDHAPAMQVAHRCHVVDMLDEDALAAVIRAERPDVVLPEVEAIATHVLAALEDEGLRVAPSARATVLTMDREGIRRLAAEALGIPTSPYRFVDSVDALRGAVAAVGVPCVVKPAMSSSGKGQSVVRTLGDVDRAWQVAQTGGRTAGSNRRPTRVIVEGFVDFDAEITLLTVRHSGGVTFCDPIGHVQVDGDYRESWQPAEISPTVLARAHRIGEAVTEALGGWGVFGVELFVVGERVLFSEVSPRPHDTGLVTLGSQDLSQFALHARAVLGLPAGPVTRLGAGAGQAGAASCAIVAEGTGVPRFGGVDVALSVPTAQVRLFGKPVVVGRRRVGVTVARGVDTDEARERARAAAAAVVVDLDPRPGDPGDPGSGDEDVQTDGRG